MKNEKWFCEAAVIRVYCERCKTATAHEMSDQMIAGLCGMEDIVCDACGRKEGSPKAVLSTTVLPIDGVYKVETLKGGGREAVLESLKGVFHYVGHPDTKAIVEGLGAVPAPIKFFGGLAIGERAVCFPIKQGLSSRATDGFTVHQAIEEIGTLDVRVITRIE